MTTEQKTFSFNASGASIARNTSQTSRLIAELGEHLTNECKTFDAWDKARADFIEGAASVGYAAPQDLWERTCKMGREWGVIPDKPKAETKHATAKAQQRAKVADASAGKTPAELIAEAQTAAKAGSFRLAAQLQSAADRATKQLQRDAEKAAKDKVQPLIDAIKTAQASMVKAGDKLGLGMLAKVAACLAQGQHAAVGKAIKPLKLKEAAPTA